MDLFGIAMGAIQQVSSKVSATIKTSTGYTIDATTRRQIPSYSTTTGYASIQALDGNDLKHLDSISIQGTVRAAYIYGELSGVVRPDSKGGDVLTFDDQEWLITKVLESWQAGTAGGWCKVAITYQGASS